MARKEQVKAKPKQYDGKVDCQNIDKRRIKMFDQDEELTCYSGLVYAVALKLKVRIVYIEQTKTGRYQILMSTDLELDPALIVKYYRLRFQIEFLILRCQTVLWVRTVPG